jgi:hypothetical protein
MFKTDMLTNLLLQAYSIVNKQQQNVHSKKIVNWKIKIFENLYFGVWTA